MQTEPLLTWSEPVTEFVGFAALFLATGAIGFRYSSLRGRLGAGAGAAVTDDHDRRVYADSAARAAALGLLGALVSAIMLATRLPALAARRHSTVVELITGNFLTGAQVVLLLAAVVGFLLAWQRVPAGWPLAAVGVVVGVLRGALVGQWSRLVNPVHELAAGLWIGTLFVLVVAGIAAVLRDEPARARRGALVADMVNRFSPLALGAAGVLVVFGTITAWRHLKRLDAIWTTPYGWTFVAKLCTVGVVVALGAWNWRRQRPTLGTEPGAMAIRRSATAELAVAALVLVLTAVLVSLPSPKG